MTYHLNPNTGFSLVAALIVLFVFYIFYIVITKDYWLSKLVSGADGKASSSKLQWTLWTIVVLYVFVTILFARIINGLWTPFDAVPQNVLLSMGLSATTMAAAKAITTDYVADGSVTKSDKKATKSDEQAGMQARRHPPGKKESFLDDLLKEGGNPDLSKVQMMAWTLIAVMMYLLTVIHIVQTNSVESTDVLNMPDIPPALMVLMGLGQGAYIGKKLVTKDTPRLSGLNPGSGKVGSKITLTGESFGDKQNGSLITVSGSPINAQVESWTDTKIEFKLPATKPNGNAWTGLVNIGLIINGRAGANEIPYSIET